MKKDTWAEILPMTFGLSDLLWARPLGLSEQHIVGASEMILNNLITVVEDSGQGSAAGRRGIESPAPTPHCQPSPPPAHNPPLAPLPQAPASRRWALSPTAPPHLWLCTPKGAPANQLVAMALARPPRRGPRGTRTAGLFRARRQARPASATAATAATATQALRFVICHRPVRCVFARAAPLQARPQGPRLFHSAVHIFIAALPDILP